MSLRARFVIVAWLGASLAWALGERVGEGHWPSPPGFLVGSALVLGIAFVASAAPFVRIRRLLVLARDVDSRVGARSWRPSGDEINELRRILLDLRERYTETSELLVSEKDLSARILDGMQEGVMAVDAQRRVVACNPALREMLLLRSDVAGRPLLEVVRHAELNAILARVGREAAPTAELEVSGLKPRRLMVRASSLAGTGGVLLVFVDVTALRKLESLRKDFVANVSHELRTPVTSVLSAAETLRLAIERTPERASSFVDIIERNAERLRALIEDILDLSRIESKELRLAVEPLRLQPLAGHVLALFRERADKRAITLRIEVDDEAQVRADRRALEQVLTNLVDNSVKYGRPGGVLRITAEPAAGGRVRIAVIDDGPGIDAEHLPRLFERFYRVDAGRSRDQGGTGLGLAIAKHLTEAMDGSLGVSSAPGQGTCFTVELAAQTMPADNLAVTDPSH